MKNKLKYSSGLNGATFLLFELKQIIKLKLEGYSDTEIRRIAQEKNVFQFNNKGRINRVLPTLMRRSEVIDPFLGEALLNRSVEVSKALNIYVIMKTDLLFFEFMDEIVGEHLINSHYFLEKKDINTFFREKEEQSDVIDSWSEGNKERLKSGLMKVLYESGILINRKGVEIKPLLLDEDVKQYLVEIGDQKYIEALGDYVV